MPALLKLLVIRAEDPDRAAAFYSLLGMAFTKHRHGQGPEHLTSLQDGLVFEIYPTEGGDDGTTRTRLGFSVPFLQQTVEQLGNLGSPIISWPQETEFGRRAVVKDFEGHYVELYEIPNSIAEPGITNLEASQHGEKR